MSKYINPNTDFGFKELTIYNILNKRIYFVIFFENDNGN